MNKTHQSPGRAEDMVARNLESITYSADKTIPKVWRCSNRKRFVKLLMSCGYSRNDAARLATTIRTPMGPDNYQELCFEATASF